MTTNFDRGVARLLPAVGEAPYWFWPPHMDVVPDGAGAFAVNRTLPRNLASQMRNVGIYCQGVVNVIRRENRLIVPTLGDSRYDGGTWAAQNFWRPYRRAFVRTAFMPRGTLVGRFFRWGPNGEVLDQGHVGVLVRANDLANQQDGLLLHSHPEVGGLAYTRLGASHANWYYDYVIWPEDWVNHNNPASKF